MDEMKKYIIEFSEDPHTVRLMKIKNGDKFPITEFKTVKPYTEPDMEQVRKEAYDKGYDDATAEIGSDEQAIAEKAYQKGLSDAWEAARKVTQVRKYGGYGDCLEEVFGRHRVSWDVFDYSASEAIEKIRQYEQKQEKEKKESIIAEDIMRQYLNTFCNERSCAGCPLDTPDFTCGRGYHFTSANPISDEEVRRAYIKVRQKMEEN